MFKNEVIDRYMHCIMQNLKKMHRFACLSIGHCVEICYELCLELLESICKPVHFFYILHNTVHISVNNFSLKHLAAQNVI